MTQIGLCVTVVIASLTVINTTLRRVKGAKMNQQFQVVYETKGVKVVNVWLPEGTELPTEWNTMTFAAQDEWLYERQAHSEDLWADEYKGEAVNVLPITQLKAVI